jgi:hypothetical protein
MLLQRAVGNETTATLFGDTHENDAGEAFRRELEASRGSGQALPAELRAEMEDRLGADLSAVRLHRDERANRLSRLADAVAFTTGADVFLGATAPPVLAPAGRGILAHELWHVVQQARGPVEAAPSRLGVPISEAESSQEREAAAVGEAIAAEPRDHTRHRAGTSHGAAHGRAGSQPIQRQRPGNRPAATVSGEEFEAEYVGWEGGAPGGAGISPTERVASRLGEIPLPFQFETDDARYSFPHLPIAFNAFVVPAAPFTRAYVRILDYQAIGVPLDPASLPEQAKRMLSLQGASPESAREAHEVTAHMTSPDANVEAAFRRVEAFQSRLLAFTSRLEVARTKMREFEARQEIRREQSALDDVRATKALVEQLLGGAATLIGLAGGLAGAFGSEAVGARAAGTAGGLAAGGELLQLVTWPFFHAEMERYERKIAELRQKCEALEKRGLILDLDIAKLELEAVAKEMEAHKIGFQQAVLARRQQAAALGTALEAAHPRMAREVGPGTMPAIIGMANAVREAAFFAGETAALLAELDLDMFVRRARMFGYMPGDDSAAHRDKKRMLVNVGTLLEYQDLIWRERMGLSTAAEAWTTVLATPTGTVGSF